MSEENVKNKTVKIVSINNKFFKPINFKINFLPTPLKKNINNYRPVMGNMNFKSTSFYEEKITNLNNSNNALKEIITSNEKIIKDLRKKLGDILLTNEKLKEKINEHKENIKKLYDNLESNLNHLDDESK